MERDIDKAASELAQQIHNERPPSPDDALNNKLTNEILTAGAERILVVFFENGQVSSFPTNMRREQITQKLSQSSGFFQIPEFAQADGFADGLVGVNVAKINFWLLRDKSNIIRPRVALA